jgi:TadE-like protein
MQSNNTNRKGRRGNAVIEVTLMAPWIFFLFVGVLDFGFYAYAFISTENAARAAVLLTSKSRVAATDRADACAIVLNELQWAAYGRVVSTNCTDPPLPEGSRTCPNEQVLVWVCPSFVPAGTGNLPTDAAQVEVRYTTIPMFPIPGALAGSFVVDRKWQMQIDPTADF